MPHLMRFLLWLSGTWAASSPVLAAGLLCLLSSGGCTVSRHDKITGTRFILPSQGTEEYMKQWFFGHWTAGNRGQSSPREEKQSRWVLHSPSLPACRLWPWYGKENEGTMVQLREAKVARSHEQRTGEKTGTQRMTYGCLQRHLLSLFFLLELINWCSSIIWLFIYNLPKILSPYYFIFHLQQCLADSRCEVSIYWIIKRTGTFVWSFTPVLSTVSDTQ